MNSRKRSFCTIGVFSMVLFMLASAECMAQAQELPVTEQWSRARKLEVFGLFQYSWVDIGRADDDVVSSAVGGAGLGYNFNPYLNVNTELSFGSIGLRRANFNESNVLAWDVNLDYNVLKHRVTPMVTAGIGVGYWSDPEVATFRCSLGLGLRWDVTDDIVVKAVYKPFAMDAREGQGIFMQGIKVIIGYMF